MIIYGGYHHINKIGEFLQFSSQRKGIRAWNFRMMIRKIWQFLWYQNRNNFEKNEKRKDQAPLRLGLNFWVINVALYGWKCDPAYQSEQETVLHFESSDSEEQKL